ncbi:MAG: GNAT family N-acetyltransferase [Candidatus Wallbacteria bacterium]|nr:GNAT family N-acetyltransferase [Candidatus Wallbacteria bacterium]
MAEFGRTGTGCSCNDPEMEALASAYQQADRFFLALLGPAGNLVGTAGVAPLEGAPLEQRVCELRKMYFTPEVRGLGLGRWLLEQCLAGARRLGYRRVYLETCEGMHAAIRLYQRNGFRRLDGPMGSTGHSGACNLYFAIDL